MPGIVICVPTLYTIRAITTNQIRDLSSLDLDIPEIPFNDELKIILRLIRRLFR